MAADPAKQLPWNSLNSHFRQRFGCKVYKLALEFGTTCPNRDGTLGWGGCSFCAEGSAGFAGRRCADLDTQIQEAKEKVAAKIVGQEARFFAYLQSFTSTYMPVEDLREFLNQLLLREDILGISVATRPDCLGEEVLQVLAKANEIKPVWVELGLQTIHDDIACSFRRGYRTSVFAQAVHRLHVLGIECVVHLIFGLPRESREMMLETVDRVCTMDIQGIKLQVLHVLQGTEWADLYNNGEFQCIEEEEWYALLCEILPRIPENIVIHRLTGDGPKKLLIAPLWTANKRNVRNKMLAYLREKGVTQGSLYKK